MAVFTRRVGKCSWYGIAIFLVAAGLPSPAVSEFQPQPCTAKLRGVTGPGSCLPMAECPPIVALAKRGRRPKPCGFHLSTLLVCCPVADVVRIPATTIPPFVPSGLIEPRNEPGCGVVVDDPGDVEHGPKGEVILKRSPWPWVVAIYQGRQFICGGALLDQDTVLTAAHCFRGDPSPDEFKVRVGVIETNETASSRSATLPVVAIRLHKGYREDRHYKDIAILKTSTRARYGTHVAPICLPNPELKLGGQVVVLGWGLTGFGGRYARRLQEGRVLVLANEDCDTVLKPVSSLRFTIPNGITDDFVCAVNETGVDACQGDSGGPLLSLGGDFRWNLVGVVSFGIRCGERFPGVYTRVTSFLPWIDKHRN